MRFLIVEDERELAATLQLGFRQHGYEVDVAYDGEAGFAAAMGTPYEALVLDRGLPKVDGIDLTRQLRRLGKTMGIVMLTARDGVDDRVAGLEAGADDYLVKPFEFKELLARVRAVTRRHLAADNVITLHDLEVDLDAGIVRQAGHIVALSRKEYVLLVYMLRFPGHLLSYERLRSHAWEAGNAPSIEGVRAHVKNMRRKLEADSGVRFIRTVHGLGYRIEP
ncbi:MAG: response regulator with CheY-like receiver domain and winged-helix DNA-binding domain [Cyanobacteria bacterium RYN_339]|nr:response regulator with CheY-like receiver domain and winged-helix DNA-binding domain [Cyanobacteria bacterium RYN_339]